MKQQTHQEDQILARLKSLVAKIRMQSSESSDLDFHVCTSNSRINPYIIEVSKGRYARTVLIDQRTVRILESGNSDANLYREIRVAILTVTKWAQDRK